MNSDNLIVEPTFESALMSLNSKTQRLRDLREFEAAKDVYIAAGRLHDLQQRSDRVRIRVSEDPRLVVIAFDEAIAAIGSASQVRQMSTLAFRLHEFVTNISRWRELSA